MFKRLFLEPLFKGNPITVLVLGVCSTLAVTVKLEPALVMGFSVMIVTGFSSFVMSLMRHTIPNRIRLIVQLVVIATLVIIVDQFLRAYAYDVSKQLSIFVGLIIVNCIIMGRIEAFALGNKPWPSFIDGLGNGAGYAIVLAAVGFFRELFGFGTLFGVRIVPEGWYIANGGFYENNGLILLPPMALILLGVVIWIQRSISKELIEKQ
jgi:Na+-transporting NADH:ubiquinone oxidoreductase subunit D